MSHITWIEQPAPRIKWLDEQPGWFWSFSYTGEIKSRAMLDELMRLHNGGFKHDEPYKELGKLLSMLAMLDATVEFTRSYIETHVDGFALTLDLKIRG